MSDDLFQKVRESAARLGETAAQLQAHCNSMKTGFPQTQNELVQALKIISIWAKNGRTEKDFDDIAKLANETIEKAKEAGL